MSDVSKINKLYFLCLSILLLIGTISFLLLLLKLIKFIIIILCNIIFALKYDSLGICYSIISTI